MLGGAGFTGGSIIAMVNEDLYNYIYDWQVLEVRPGRALSS